MVKTLASKRKQNYSYQNFQCRVNGFGKKSSGRWLDYIFAKWIHRFWWSVCNWAISNRSWTIEHFISVISFLFKSIYVFKKTIIRDVFFTTFNDITFVISSHISGRLVETILQRQNWYWCGTTKNFKPFSNQTSGCDVSFFSVICSHTNKYKLRIAFVSQYDGWYYE